MEKKLSVVTYFGDVSINVCAKTTVNIGIQELLSQLFIQPRHHYYFALLLNKYIIMQKSDRIYNLTDRQLTLVLLRYPQLDEFDDIPVNLLKYSYIQMNNMLHDKRYNISVADLFYLQHINQYVSESLRVDVVPNDINEIYKVQRIHMFSGDRQAVKAMKQADENTVLCQYLAQCKKILKLYDYWVIQCYLIKHEGMYHTNADVGINDEKIIILENEEVFFTDYLYNVQFMTDSRGIYIWNDTSRAFIMFKDTINFQDYILFFKQSQCIIEKEIDKKE